MWLCDQNVGQPEGQKYPCFTTLNRFPPWKPIDLVRSHNPKVVGSNPAPATKSKALKTALFSRPFLMGI
jgi:hypothetical protein